MQVQIEIDDQIIADTLCSAREGGMSANWCSCIRIYYAKMSSYDTKMSPSDRAYAIMSGTRWHVTESETEKTFVLGIAAIFRGLRLMAKHNPYQFGLMLAQQGDAITGDVFLQFCTLGEEKYG